MARGEVNNVKTEYPERYRNMGLRIAYYRKQLGYTQETLAELVGISWNYLAQIEGTGTIRGVSLEVLFRISDVLCVQPGRLLDDEK